VGRQARLALPSHRALPTRLYREVGLAHLCLRARPARLGCEARLGYNSLYMNIEK